MSKRYTLAEVLTVDQSPHLLVSKGSLMSVTGVGVAPLLLLLLEEEEVEDEEEEEADDEVDDDEDEDVLPPLSG